MKFVVYLQDVGLIIPLALLFLLSLVPITIKILNKNREQKPVITLFQGVFSVVAVGVLIALRNTSDVVLAFENTIVFSPYIKLTTIVLILSTLFALFLSYRSPSVPKEQYSEHVFLILNALLGMLVLNYSNDLLITFIGIEMLSLPLYVLVGMVRDTMVPREASFKYFILGSFASAFLLLGIAFIFGATQTTDLTKIAAAYNEGHSVFFTFGVLAFLVGMFFKAGLVPFHAWLPDVYHGAPTPITAFMAPTVKLVIFVYMLGLVDILRLMNMDLVIPALQWIAVLTMFLGNIAALRQKSLKRLLAYSSISHSGYMFLGIIAAILGGGELAYQGVLFYVLIYTFMIMGSFGLMCVYENKEGDDLQISSLKGLYKDHPWLAFSMAALLVSFAGIPPLGGFFAKVFLFSSAIQVGQYWLVTMALISSAISLYYYLKPVVYMYMNEKEGTEGFANNMGVSNLSIVYLSVIMVFVMGIFSQPFLIRILKTLV